MMINLWIVRFEDHEVKKAYATVKEKAEEAVVIYQAYVMPAVDKAAHIALRGTEVGLRKASEGLSVAADYINDIDAPVARRVRAFKMAKEMVAAAKNVTNAIIS